MNIADKILLGIIGFNPKSFKKESEEMQYLIHCFSVGFMRWCEFMNNQSNDFNKHTDEELLIMYDKYCEEQIKNRLKK